MDVLKDTKINKVYKGKSGDFGYGQVTFWSIYMQGSELKFSYAQKEHMAPPVEGTPITKLVYDEKQSGEYTNYNITEMVTGEGGAPDTSSENRHQPHTPKPPPSGKLGDYNDTGPFSMNKTYPTEIACALINKGIYSKEKLGEVVADVIDITIFAMSTVKSITPPAPLPPSQNPEEDDSDIPF